MMPGIDGAMLGLDDEHVAAVAIADDLILQVARRVLAAQIRLERRAQPRALLAQLRAQARQLGAGVVVDLAGRIDLAAHFGDLVLERSAALRDAPSASGTAPLTRRIAAHVSATESRNSANASSRSGSSARPSTASADEHRVEIVGRVQRKRGIGVEILDAFGRRGEQLRGAMRIGLRLELGEPRRAERRQRKAAHDVDDLIPLEGAKRAGLHL